MICILTSIYEENNTLFPSTLILNSQFDLDSTKTILKETTERYLIGEAKHGYTMPYDFNLGDIIELIESDSAFVNTLALHGITPFNQTDAGFKINLDVGYHNDVWIDADAVNAHLPKT